MQRILTLTAASLISMALGVAGATAASVATPDNPSGCTDTPTNFSISGTGHMSATAHGDCKVRATRDLIVQIKHDLSWRPDPVVHANDDYAYALKYAATVGGCDNHTQASYYGRGYFSENPTYTDSRHIYARVC